MRQRTALEFLVVPDSGAARRVRRLLAQSGARSGVVVGTWPELVQRACRSYCVPQAPRDADEAFLEAMAELEDAFWAESFAVAPEETGKAIRAALVDVLAASDPDRGIDERRLQALAQRPRQLVADLLRLGAALSGKLPGHLTGIRNVLRCGAADALQLLRVHRLADIPRVTRWEAALADKLNRNAAEAGRAAEDEGLLAALQGALAAGPSAPPDSSLRALQTRLLAPGAGGVPLDDSVQWVGVRDFHQEADVAAGLAQSLLAAQSDLRPADIGLLAPDSFEYSVALEDAFGLAGLPLAGLPAERWKRDLGYEAVFHFLYCRQKPAPAMALAVCLASPLMPWPPEVGASLAQAVMDGDYRSQLPPSCGKAAQAMLQLLLGGDAEPGALAGALADFGSLLEGGERFAVHAGRAREVVGRLRSMLEQSAELDWAGLRRVANPHFLVSGEAPEFTLEGVTVWLEGREPWRPVRHLIVCGFAQGRYPAAPRASSVFAPDDIRAIREAVGLPLALPADSHAERRTLFVRQLQAAAESATFLIPRRDERGQAQAPSESMVFMEQIFKVPAAGDLIAELDAAQGRARIRHLARAPGSAPQPPRDVRSADLDFGRDLLAMRKDEAGNVKPESPSSLEAPMISPLAWLLRRCGAEPLLWAPEKADLRLIGTLTHRVFEELFRPGQDLPAPDDIPVQVGLLLDQAALQQAPFLRSPQWQVERRHLAEQIRRAALVWRDVLGRLNAKVLASEQWLEGNWSGIRIHGQTDLILGLPRNRVLVVDYKWAKSQGRLKRMERGFDSQASLYRAMVENGGPKAPREGEGNSPNGDLAGSLSRAQWIGIVYFMMRDGVCLADGGAGAAGFAEIPAWQALDEDVARNALELIRKRLDELRSGLVRLNRAADAEFFEKQAGITPYALSASPLIGLFTLP